MKKIFTIFMSVLFVCSLVIPAIALDAKEQPNYYRTEEGETIVYYLDKNGCSYIYKNGKKMYALLCLEQYRIKDETKINELKAQVAELEEPVTRSSSEQILFDGNISLKNPNATTVGFLIFPINASFTRLKISNCKPLYANKRVNITITWRQHVTEQFFSYSVFDQSLTGTGELYNSSGRVVDRVKYDIYPRGSMTSCRFIARSTAYGH